MPSFVLFFPCLCCFYTPSTPLEFSTCTCSVPLQLQVNPFPLHSKNCPMMCLKSSTPASVAEDGRGEAKILQLPLPLWGKSSEITTFKWNNFAKVKDEDCQLLCTQVCPWFALAWMLPGSLAEDPCCPAATM